MPEQNDMDWVAQVRAGDESAARRLIQRLYPVVMKSVRAHLPRRASEEELAQAVFVKIFNKLDQFSGLVPLEHWVTRITINTCLTELRRERGRPEVRMADLGENEQAVVEQLLSTPDDLSAEHSRDARELLDRLLRGLKPEERLLIELLHLEERSTREISQLTGWPVGRVKVKAFRARLKLRKLWAQLQREEPVRWTGSIGEPRPILELRRLQPGLAAR